MLLAICGKEILALGLIRYHAFVLEHVIGFHFADVPGLILLKVQVKIYRFFFSFAGGAWHPLKMGLLVILANPADVLFCVIAFLVLADGLDPLDSGHFQHVALFLLLVI